ncbi:hypothetical protein [Moraxella bovis]|uniref:Uncharacterized protein n=1 Tax=Moraxella bovis TaxID=476 RepID=A0A378PXD1_MORBO|nr:hypothetical protein [Moraxella bovis]STY92935.1 Uncharacterised protein [Moraxella bovis]
MANKKEILAYAKQHGFIYPKIKVIFGFGLCGGAIGLFIMMFGVFTEGMIKDASGILSRMPTDTTIYSMVSGIFSFLFGGIALGTIFGCIPAFLTGIYCAIFNFIMMKKLDYAHLYVVGTIFSAIYFNHWLNLPDEFWQRMFDLWVWGSIGGISAMICGKFFLPKLPNNF